ncbi:MAG: hypothetical protein ACR2OU_06975 [Thermomicrobiales bacterium]
MAKDSVTFRLRLTEPDAVKAVSDAIAGGRTKFTIKEEGNSYFKLKQRHSYIFAPVSLDIGFRRESPDTTVVVINGGTWWIDFSSRGASRTRTIMDKFQDDVQGCASRYVRQDENSFVKS